MLKLALSYSTMTIYLSMEKTFNQSKSWIYRAVGLLSFNGGFVNSITFESFFHNPPSGM